jgi:exopolysaccharide biosynthesis predicted pyruvyltransferase EpsI
LKIAHLGSFQGNIGDQLSHYSFRRWFQDLVPKPIIWQSIEIRDTFRGLGSVRQQLNAASSASALVVIGGGNFWELWPRNSRTGTTIDVTTSELRALGKPVFFNSLGIDSGQGISINGRNFPSHLKELLEDENFFVTVRNDGALQNLEDAFGWRAELKCLPDHGFFAFDAPAGSPGSSEAEVAINLASDMPQTRFANSSLQAQLAAIAEGILSLDEMGVKNFTIVPHIWKDLEVALELLRCLPDRIARENVQVAGLTTGLGNSPISKFEPYRRSSLVIATRFHANVAALANGKKLLPLVNYPQIFRLLENLPTPWTFSRLDSKHLGNWSRSMVEAAQASDETYQTFTGKVMGSLRADRHQIATELISWLKIHGLGSK